MITWNQHLQTPVLFNHHESYQVNSTTISRVDLNNVRSTPRAISNQERVLILTPLRNAAPYLTKYFDLLSDLTYPHDLIDLAFLVGDSNDETLAVLASELDRVQKRGDKIRFRSATIVQKDFGVGVDMDVQKKHAFAAQGQRRKAMGRARNYLLSAALKSEHSWVYWRDVDIQDSPKTILEDFMTHDRDILVPSISVRSPRKQVLADKIWQISGFIGIQTAITTSKGDLTTIHGSKARRV
jgi:cellulose synthase/poly-beta-1,6-N-acetylglucosamine synthase-like glycosyltransferase